MKDKYFIEDKKKFSFRNFILQWEFLLIIILIGIIILNSFLSPNFLKINTIFNSIKQFLDKGFIVLPMTLVLMLGCIDISVGSLAALSAVIIGMCFQSGMPMALALCIGILVGAICGILNGILVSNFDDVPPMILTLGAMGIYRGISYILIENKSISGFPTWFSNFSWGNILGIPVILIIFAIVSIAFIWLLHKTALGREIYAIGFNKKTSLFSGIKVKKNMIIVYCLLGIMSAFCGIFLMSRMSSVRADIAVGYELEVIAMVVLGGVSTSGGIGKMFGPIIAVFIIGFLRYGLGLINVSSQIITLIIGLLLVGSVLVSNAGILNALNIKTKERK